MRVAVTWDPGDTHGAALAARLGERGIEVVALEAGRPLVDTFAGSLADAVAGVDAAIDAMVAQPDRKRSVLKALDEALPPDKPILACCHAASATGLGAAVGRPERLSGYALLPPWAQRTVVECARGVHTSDAAAAAAEAVWSTAGFEAVWVGDSVGLVGPRIVACLANEAAFAVMEGVAGPEDVDRAMELGTRYPMGPLAWAETIGLAHVVAILDGLADELREDRYRTAPILRRMAAARTHAELGPAAGSWA